MDLALKLISSLTPFWCCLQDHSCINIHESFMPGSWDEMFFNWVLSAAGGLCFTADIKCILHSAETWVVTKIIFGEISRCSLLLLHLHLQQPRLVKLLNWFLRTCCEDMIVLLVIPVYVDNIQHCIKGNYIYIFRKCSVRLENFPLLYRQIFIFNILPAVMNDLTWNITTVGVI